MIEIEGQAKLVSDEYEFAVEDLILGKNLTKCLRHDISNHTMHDKLRCVTAEEFYTAISHSMSDDDRGCFLSDYSLGSYTNMDRRVLLHNNLAGFAVKEGDIVSVFSSRQNPVKQSLDIMMPSAISLGGVKLDCLGGPLRRKYAKYGFVAVAAVRFLDECAPDNWDYDKFGGPDVYFMAHEQQLSCKARDDLTGGHTLLILR